MVLGRCRRGYMAIESERNLLQGATKLWLSKLGGRLDETPAFIRSRRSPCCTVVCGLRVQPHLYDRPHCVRACPYRICCSNAAALCFVDYLSVTFGDGSSGMSRIRTTILLHCHQAERRLRDHGRCLGAVARWGYITHSAKQKRWPASDPADGEKVAMKVLKARQERVNQLRNRNVIHDRIARSRCRTNGTGPWRKP
jgi:hypothetical protein